MAPYSIDSPDIFIPGPPEVLPKYGPKNHEVLAHTYHISIFQPSDGRNGLPCGHTRPIEVTAYVHLCVIDMLYPFRKC